MKDLTQGPVARQLLGLAGFMMIGMIVQILYSLIDLYWVGRLGASAQAAVPLGGNMMMQTMAQELAPKIRVNAINPGLVITEGAESAGIVGSDFEKNAVASTPLGRAGQPEDIALPVAFLASDDARWITGETIFVSGGAAI